MKSLPKTYVPKRASVIGAAKSGIGAARFLLSRGTEVFISDTCAPEKLQQILQKAGLSHIASEASAHSEKVLHADVIVLSPGVPSNLPVLLRAKEQGIPVWSEVELAFRFTDATFLAITGSSGKSTTTAMLGAILQASGIGSAVAGNIGIPLIDVVTTMKAGDIVAAELSSFQLETIDLFRPRAAAVLNFLKNHLDRYENEDAYYDAKKEIARNFTKENRLVLNINDPRLCEWGEEMRNRATLMWFGGRAKNNDDCVWFENDTIQAIFNGKQLSLLSVKDMILSGPHNYDNASAAAALALAADIPASAIAAGISSFRGLPHRLEYVAEVNGIRYYNDSKATTAESVLCAVTAFGNNVHLIAGGRDKGCDFSIVKDAVRSNTRGVYLIGEAADRIELEWKDSANIVRCDSLKDAVAKATANAQNGDVVVLSPGCSSFDMFENYEKRGEAFRALIKGLAK